MTIKFQVEKLPNDELKELSELIGLENIILLCKLFGGSTIYIPKADIFSRHDRNNSILKDYRKGYTYLELAKKYNLTTVSIRNIISSFL